jgi:hypothetical protein
MREMRGLLFVAALVLTVDVSADNALQIESEGDIVFGEEESLSDEPLLGDEFDDTSIVITSVALVTFNLIVFLLVCCCPCVKVRFKIDLSHERERKNNRYPHIRTFKTNSYCFTEG